MALPGTGFVPPVLWGKEYLTSYSQAYFSKQDAGDSLDSAVISKSHVSGPYPDQVIESLETVMASLGKCSAYFTLTNAVGTSVHQFQLL